MSGTVMMEDFDGRAARPHNGLDAEATIPEGPESATPATPGRRPPLTGAFRSVDELPVEALEGPGTFTGGRRPRPLTVTVLFVLWTLSVPLYLIAGVALALATQGMGRAAPIAAGLAMATLSMAMAFGLWQGRRWARVAQIPGAAPPGYGDRGLPRRRPGLPPRRRLRECGAGRISIHADGRRRDAPDRGLPDAPLPEVPLHRHATRRGSLAGRRSGRGHSRSA